MKTMSERKMFFWTQHEDDLIKKLFKKGIRKWSEIAKHIPGKSGTQCRERWLTHLDNSGKKVGWSEADDVLLLKVFKLHGNKFSAIAKVLPGRTEQAIKNRLQMLTNKENNERYSPIPFEPQLSHVDPPSILTSPLGKLQDKFKFKSSMSNEVNEQPPLTMREMRELAEQFVKREVSRQQTMHGISISKDEQEMMLRAFISGMEHTTNPIEFSGNNQSEMQWEFEQNECESLDAIGFSFDEEGNLDDNLVVTGRQINAHKSDNQRESWEIENDDLGESFDGLSFSMVNMSLEESRDES